MNTEMSHATSVPTDNDSTSISMDGDINITYIETSYEEYIDEDLEDEPQINRYPIDSIGG